jgi:hypothetical protein
MTLTPGTLRAASPRLWRWHLALLLAPVLVLWRQDNSLFTGSGFIDPWLYYGFFRNLGEFKGALFFGTYYGSRLSWLLPGWAVHALLPPLAASAVLHLLVHSVAMLGLFTALRVSVGLRPAFLTALLFTTHPWLWMSTGWDNPDGAGLAYCALALALLALASERERPRLLLTGAGAALGAMIYTNLFLVAIAPMPVLFYLARRTLTGWRAALRSVVPLAIWLGAGFAAVTVALGLVNVALDGHFWFYAPSVLAAMRLLSDRNPWFTTVWGPHGLAPYLWMAGLAAACSLAALCGWRRAPRERTLCAALFLAALSVHVLLQTRGTPALGIYYYASYLLPFAFLAMGAIFFPAVDALSGRAYLALCAATALAAATAWGEYSGGAIPAWPAGASVAAAGCAALMAAAFLLRRRALGAVLATAGILLLSTEVRTVALDPHGNRAGEERLIFFRARIEAERKERPVRIWYSETDPAAADARALVSTYIGTGSSLGTAFPTDKCDDTVEPGMLAAVASSLPDLAATARRTLAACWSPLGLEPQSTGADSLVGELGGYAVLRFRAGLKPGARIAAEVPPFDRWTPSSGAVTGKDAAGLRLRTPPVAAGIALVSPPLIAPAAGRYRFALRYRNGSGHIAFGAVGAGGMEWKRRDVDERRLGAEEELSVWLTLEAGEQVRLAVANYHWKNVASSAVLTGVSGIRVPQP